MSSGSNLGNPINWTAKKKLSNRLIGNVSDDIPYVTVKSLLFKNKLKKYEKIIT